MKNHKILIISLTIELAIILSIALANLVGGNGFYIFYNLVYGIILSTLVPIFLVLKEKNTLSSLGIKNLGLKQCLVIVGFVVFSIGGQIIPISIGSIDLGLIAVGLAPLIMTTFFEEFLFRGFMQTRFEQQYGWLPAVLLSGFFFSIYHLGYPGFRTVIDLLILFAVGIGFALAFKLAGGNVIVSYIVNLPNAVLTYVLKSTQFPVFDKFTSVIAYITIVLIILIMVFFIKKLQDRKSKSITQCV